MNERSIFAAALDITDPAQRAAYLDEACGQQPGLRQHIEELLAAQEKLGSFLARPLAMPYGTQAYEPIAEGPGTRIGPYKLLQQIGEGGMGIVYMAEQEQPVRRKVALKIIKPGMDSRQVIARFEAERQALALMDHPNIARVLDAGTTESGRPYFVMELVHGVPITKFCDDNQLTPRQRLELFLPVCQAIQHAHQKGIIHRDVKPSNVLVTLYDDRPVPKVIDFGVAKAVEQRLTAKTLFTQYGTLVGTFEYMSPEQAEMNAIGVDTRSDIYSLGVLLYELLTGTTPLERQRVREAALDELVRLIREEEPPRPSLRLSSSDTLPKIAAARKTEPAQLSKLVKGEIDWIVMKCLEKDRTRRYETASGLARDVGRYLADEPVEACPPSAGYKLRKFAGKHKKQLATLGVLACLLMTGLSSCSVLVWRQYVAERAALEQARAAAEAQNRAQQMNDELFATQEQRRRMLYAAQMNLAQAAWEANDVERLSKSLKQLRPKPGEEDLRGFEWYYLSRLGHANLLTLKHSQPVISVAFSPEGKRLATTNGEHTDPPQPGELKVWDAQTGRELLSPKGHTGCVTGLAFSPDAQRLATGSDDETIRIWDATVGKELLCLKGHSGEVWSVVFSPDGKRLASASEDKTVKVWDAETGQLLLTLNGHAEAAYGVAFSPDGQRLASCGGRSYLPDVPGEVKVWDAQTGRALLTRKGHTGSVLSIAFSPDGNRFATASRDRSVRIWDTRTGQPILTLKGHSGMVNAVIYSPDGKRLATASDDRTVKVWDAQMGLELLSLKGHTDLVNSVAFSPDGKRLASASDDGTVKVWDATPLPDYSGEW